MSGSEVSAILTKHGFEAIRQRGSHVAMQKKADNSTITVIVPDHNEIELGTFKSIIRQSQLPSSNFEVL